ncbi:BolA family protein [Candidatus Erwinia haradaeae]|uniref:Acid stress protein IbaG n=1 Tax=Candidatus Erwinia haradaeae TaxID=1922217 RepID=A0A451D222_9GAMM|nr:BolA family protein [Candidatus Erwinia haradaeae]VFP79659.1 Acid stress protein IbaG [Candidatus Erwinia haradaeae]
MVNNNTIHSLLLKQLPLQEVYISGNSNHLHIIAISKTFLGISRVKQQQIIYSSLAPYITKNHIHAVSIKTYTPEEWKRNCE